MPYWFILPLDCDWSLNLIFLNSSIRSPDYEKFQKNINRVTYKLVQITFIITSSTIYNEIICTQ